MISVIKKIKKVNIPFILFIFFICFSLLTFYNIKNIKQKESINSSIIQEKLIKIKELATTKYTYSKILEVQNSKTLSGMNIPFTEKYFLLQYDGYIKAGVDLSKVSIDIDKKNNGVTITLDKSKIQEHVIDQNSIHLYDEKSSIFNKLELQDMINEINNEKPKLEQDVIKKGLLEESDSNAKTLLEELIKSLGFNSIHVVLK